MQESLCDHCSVPDHLSQPCSLTYLQADIAKRCCLATSMPTRQIVTPSALLSFGFGNSENEDLTSSASLQLALARMTSYRLTTRVNVRSVPPAQQW